MKHFKADDSVPSAQDCDTATRGVSPDAAVTLPPRVEERVVMVFSPPGSCAPSPTEGGTPSEFEQPITIRSSDECLGVKQLGPREFEIYLTSCGDGAGFNLNECEFKIQNGFVKAFPLPVVKITSSDSSLQVTRNGCEIDLKANTSSTSPLDALPSRVLCAIGSCAEAGKAIGFVQVTRLESNDYQLSGCALAGEGATGAALSYSVDVFDDLASAVSAMNAATLTASFGSCTGGG